MQFTVEHTINNWKHYTLENNNGMQVKFLDFGGIITNITVPDQNGQKENIVLTYKNVVDYKKNPLYLGALIGRVAGRIANAEFAIGDKAYKIGANEGNHHLHGGNNGLHQVIWDTEAFSTENSVGVKLSHTSPHGTEGYPGTVQIMVTYTLTNNNEFIIDYHATTDRPTIFTMTNHSYFNLSGNVKSTVHNHQVIMASDQFVELDEELIPTGRKLHVDNTVFDFRSGRRLSEGISSDFSQNVIVGNGYDHYFLFSSPLKREQIRVSEKTSGRHMTIYTNQPGVVMYTSNGMAQGIQLESGLSKKYLGVCFETQGSPAALQHKDFPNIILHPNEVYEKQTLFSFGW